MNARSLACSFFLGCATTEVHLADLENRSLHVGTSVDGLVAELWFDLAGSGDLAGTGDLPRGGDCPVLAGSFRATLDGRPVRVVPNDHVDLDTWCVSSPLQLRVDDRPAASANSRLELRDDSLAIVAYLGDVFVPRRASPATTTPTRGERLTIHWSPVSDLERFPPRVEIRQGASLWPGGELVIEGDRLELTVPSRELLVPGAAMLEVHMTAEDDTPRCTNARCTLAASRHDRVPVELQ